MTERWFTQTETCNLPLPPEGLQLRCGDVLSQIELAYEAYGTLNDDGTNAIFICHALTGDSHAAGWHSDDPDERPGWWDELIGPGKAVDTNKFYVVCANVLGGCKGSTGPASTNPETGNPFGAGFPRVTIADTVAAERILLDQLGIKRLYAVIGGSMGGMRALQWAVSYPDFVERCVCVATAAHLNTQALAFDVIGRNEIEQDPHWCNGDYYDNDQKPDKGLASARRIGHVTYLSSASMRARFGREVRNDPWPGPKSRFSTDFQVESYLAYQGQKFVSRFDANSYLYVTHMMDMFDLREEHGSLANALASTKSKFLVVAVSSDWLFPPSQQLEIVTALLANRKEVSFFQIDSDKGHDAFLLEYEAIGRGVDAFLSHNDDDPHPINDLSKRQDADHIRNLLDDGTHLLDVGSGGGDLLHALARERKVTGICVDRDFDSVVQCLRKGLSAIQLDADKTLPCLPSDSFDCVLLNQTIQQLHSPLGAIREMLRVAPHAVIGFPNFAYYRYRWSLLVGGRLPKSETLPFEWYDTPNIHLVTVHDFQELCERNDIIVTDLAHLSDCSIGNLFLAIGLKNLGCERAIARIARS